MPDVSMISGELITHAQLLFRQRGYDAVSEAEIAAAAGISPESAPAKMLVALAIYQQLTIQLRDTARELPQLSLSDRYAQILEARIAQYQTDEETLSALFANLMRRSGGLQPTDLSSGKQDALYQVFELVISQASDAPGSAQDSNHLTMLLYAFHFVVTLFWLYDRTPDHQATTLLIDFLRDVFKVIRPLMIMPIFGKAMTKLAQIMMLVFGGARLVPPSTS